MDDPLTLGDGHGDPGEAGRAAVLLHEPVDGRGGELVVPHVPETRRCRGERHDKQEERDGEDAARRRESLNAAHSARESAEDRREAAPPERDAGVPEVDHHLKLGRRPRRHHCDIPYSTLRKTPG
ncbi:hypothetical protein GCM10022226_70310 [Sphaerisporangium flaviroseum]|uniref:Uncharacterized protein n=1 Tax=Sphaerisporangium flaviroseum TaxID=509199 RepID=A0ABP7JAH9_9ACTN